MGLPVWVPTGFCVTFPPFFRLNSKPKRQKSATFIHVFVPLQKSFFLCERNVSGTWRAEEGAEGQWGRGEAVGWEREEERGEKCETAERQMIWPLSRRDDSGTMAQLELIRIINWRNVLPP